MKSIKIITLRERMTYVLIYIVPLYTRKFFFASNSVNFCGDKTKCAVLSKRRQSLLNHVLNT